MIDLNTSPVSLAELKKHLRIDNDLLDDNLTIMLLAAVEDVEKFTLIDFATDYKDIAVPYALKAAILLTAGRMFESPTDAASTMPTIASNLIKKYRKWERIKQV